MNISLPDELITRLKGISDLLELSRPAKIAYLIDRHAGTRKPKAYYIAKYPTRGQSNQARWQIYEMEHAYLTHLLGHPPSLKECEANSKVRFTAKILARLGKQNGA